MSGPCLADVPAVEAVHPVGRDPEKAGGGQRHPARGVTHSDVDVHFFLNWVVLVAECKRTSVQRMMMTTTTMMMDAALWRWHHSISVHLYSTKEEISQPLTLVFNSCLLSFMMTDLLTVQEKPRNSSVPCLKISALF